jgi:hypothetical protein
MSFCFFNIFLLLKAKNKKITHSTGIGLIYPFNFVNGEMIELSLKNI